MRKIQRAVELTSVLVVALFLTALTINTTQAASYPPVKIPSEESRNFLNKR
jgi:hypothetical protein